jgi:hypothetical protein
VVTYEDLIWVLKVGVEVAVDLACHPLAYKIWSCGALLHHADKLMSERSIEARHVPFDDLQICGADACALHFDKSLIVSGDWLCAIKIDPQTLFLVEYKGFHRELGESAWNNTSSHREITTVTTEEMFYVTANTGCTD